MNIEEKIILADTNIITDLFIAGVLENFIDMDNVFMSKLVKYNEVNDESVNRDLFKRIKVINETITQIEEVSRITAYEKSLSPSDLMNYIIARDYNYLLVTGDKKLREYSKEKGIEVRGTIWIIDKMLQNEVIKKDDALFAYKSLYLNDKTRLPKNELEKRITELEKEETKV